MIDLHLHTTASDGRLAPRDLVARAAVAGVTVLAVTDHDTTDGLVEAAAEAARRQLVLVTGIEITAVDDGRDVHMLGYFFDARDQALARFLTSQRLSRITRLSEMAARLQALGMPLEVQPLIDEARVQPGKAVGRPALARAMVAAGYVADMREAFDRWLGRGCAAFVERSGVPPEDVIRIVHDACGLVSLAHPGRTQIDERISALRAAGLDAIEAYHSDHDLLTARRYLQMAGEMDLLVTGGSDFHGDPGHGLEPGSANLPQSDWVKLCDASARYASR